MKIYFLGLLCPCAHAARGKISSHFEVAELAEKARSLTANATNAKNECRCKTVGNPEDCQRTRSLTVHNNALGAPVFKCCTWWPRTGGKYAVGEESKTTFHDLPFSLADSDAKATGDASFSAPVEANRKSCYTHMRYKALQAKNGDKCGLPGHCSSNCCCVQDNSLKALKKDRIRGKCISPAQCKQKKYKCVEKVNPTLSELSSLKNSAYKWARVEDKARAVSYRWYHRVNHGPEPQLKAGEPGVCFLLRRTGFIIQLGIGGVAALGSEAAKVAADMKVFHWDVNYANSPFLSSFKEIFIARKDDLHTIPWSEHCRAGKDEVFTRMVNKWGFREPTKMRLEEAQFGTSLFARSSKFTWAISANTGGLLEFRFAMMEAKSGNKLMGEIMDLNAKHAFLVHTEDYTMYAGEAWVQFTPEALKDCATKVGKKGVITCLVGKMDDPAKNAMLVVDNDSGTFKASPAIDIRQKVQKLLHTAWGSQLRINVCSIPGLLPDELDDKPGAPCSDIKYVRSADLIAMAKLG